MNTALRSTTWAASVLALALASTTGTALAADAPPASGVVNLTASAATEVAKDLMTLTLTATRDGSDAAAVQSALKQALDTALAEARREARPGQVDVQTGNFSLYPRYTDKGAVSGWQGSAELLIEGRDMPAIGKLAGRIGSMTISRVVYGVSRDLRERSEADIAAQAIARYRAKAADCARLFGYGGYVIREVTVSGNEAPPDMAPRMRVQTMAAARADAPLPVEAGKAVLSVSVTGTVQLTR
jgi:predicted secreted protein